MINGKNSNIGDSRTIFIPKHPLDEVKCYHVMKALLLLCCGMKCRLQALYVCVFVLRHLFNGTLLKFQ